MSTTLRTPRVLWENRLAERTLLESHDFSEISADSIRLFKNAIRLSIDSLIVSNDFLIASADSLMLLTHVPTDTGVLFQGKAKNVGVMVELTVL